MARPSVLRLKILVLGTLALWPVAAPATECSEDAMIVFDGSGSMAEMGFNRLGLPRIVEARQAIRHVAPRVAPVRRLGLISYGPGAFEACAAPRLHFAPRPDAGQAIIDAVEALEPSGETPLTRAVAEAAEVVSGGGTRRGTVVLVTDGRETCGGAPCALAAELAAGDMVTVHVIGFKLRGDHFAFPGGAGDADYETGTTVAACLAERTGGSYVNAQSLNALIGALQETLGCPVYGALGAGR